MTDVKDAAISFEGRKVRMNQSKDGWLLTLAIHPDEVDEALMRTLVGSRYAVVMVPIGDDEQPIADPKKVEANRAVTSAVMLAKNHKFQAWANVADRDDPEAAAIAFIKARCDIQSRKDLSDNPIARQAFEDMKSEFMEEALGR